MKYKIWAAQLNEMIEESQLLASNGGKEICGLLVDNGYFIEMIRLKNKEKKSGGFSFYVKEAEFIEKACKRMNHEIIGTFHSHPYYIAKPGKADIAAAFEIEIMLVIDVMDKNARLWLINNKKLKELQFEMI